MQIQGTRNGKKSFTRHEKPDQKSCLDDSSGKDLTATARLFYQNKKAP